MVREGTDCRFLQPSAGEVRCLVAEQSEEYLQDLSEPELVAFRERSLRQRRRGARIPALRPEILWPGGRTPLSPENSGSYGQREFRPGGVSTGVAWSLEVSFHEAKVSRNREFIDAGGIG